MIQQSLTVESIGTGVYFLSILTLNNLWLRFSGGMARFELRYIILVLGYNILQLSSRCPLQCLSWTLPGWGKAALPCPEQSFPCVSGWVEGYTGVFLWEADGHSRGHKCCVYSLGPPSSFLVSLGRLVYLAPWQRAPTLQGPRPTKIMYDMNWHVFPPFLWVWLIQQAQLAPASWPSFHVPSHCLLCGPCMPAPDTGPEPWAWPLKWLYIYTMCHLDYATFNSMHFLNDNVYSNFP